MNPLEAVADLGRWGQAHQWWLLGALGLLPLVGGAAALARGTRREQTTHGSARWSTVAEVRKAGLYAAGGVVLGKFGGNLLCDDSETHVVVVGPTRSGKGVGHVIPTLKRWRGSVLVLDPKDGENYDATVADRQQVGPVYAFSPHTSPRTRINVYDSVRWGTPHEPDDIHIISRSLTAPDMMVHETPLSLHFRDLASWLLDAGGVHIHYASPRKSLGGLWAFLMQHDSLPGAMKTMGNTRHVAGGVHPFVRDRVNAIRNITGDRELSGVWTTAVRPLEPFSHPYCTQSTEQSDMDLRALQWGKTPASLYLLAQHPLSLERLAPVYRVVLDTVLEMGMRTKVRRYRHRLLTVGDEVAWYGYSRSVDKGPAVQAGYGQKNVLVFQNLGDLFSTFGHETPIWGNAHIKVFHAPSDDRVAKRVSENMLGRQTIQTQSESQQAGLLGRRSISTHDTGRALLMPDEVMNLAPEQALIQVQGLRPILANKCDYRRRGW